MEMVMLAAGVIGAITAIFVFLSYGWMSGFSFFLLSLICYGLSRVFDFLGDLLATIGRDEKGKAEP